MPRNPSPKQSETSRRNLKGKEGPKTDAGKRVSAANGSKNKGVKTAKVRAAIIAARHKNGLNDESYYAYAGCLDCTKHCVWPSFSPTTPFESLPLGCLDDVLKSRPERCFYHLEGLCLSDLGRRRVKVTRETACVVDPRFIDGFATGDEKEQVSDLNRTELIFRKRIIRFVGEARLYLDQLRKGGFDQITPHPRMLNVLRMLRRALNKCAPCRFTPWKDDGEWDECLRWIADGIFEK